MDKRYQVFISSTYADLKEERQRIIQALMEMDCIPAGMELFPAADEDQFAFIKKIIDDCDYYILMIGGRYGSLTATGISYTEQEYEYALSRGLRVIALLHESPDDIPLGKSEKDPVLRERLRHFRERVSKERLVRFWKSASELPGIVALSLSKTIKTYPALGWVRADKVASETLFEELNEVRKQNAGLAAELKRNQGLAKPSLENLASLDESIQLSGSYWRDGRAGISWSATMTWRQIFAAICPYLLQQPNSHRVKDILEAAAFEFSGRTGKSPILDDQVFQTVSLQLRALGLVEIKYLQTTAGGMALFWSATPAGEQLTLELRTVKTSKKHEV
ncbi:MAG TPA: DUF4062 domain-containing protein [Holophagaceae bacterium]|nr:DUF4062 domain-containing protein [Holophagaceae bacterium]